MSKWCMFQDVQGRIYVKCNCCVVLEAQRRSCFNDTLLSDIIQTHIVCHFFLDVNISIQLIPATDVGACFEEGLKVLNRSLTEMLQQDKETSDVCIKTVKLAGFFFFLIKRQKDRTQPLSL